MCDTCFSMYFSLKNGPCVILVPVGNFNPMNQKKKEKKNQNNHISFHISTSINERNIYDTYIYMYLKGIKKEKKSYTHIFLSHSLLNDYLVLIN